MLSPQYHYPAHTFSPLHTTVQLGVIVAWRVLRFIPIDLSGPEGAQLKKELEDLKDALKRKDDIIKEQQKRIASLIEANKTLSEGLEQLHRMNSDLSGSESEDESIPVRHTHSTEPPKNFAMNGQSNGSAFKHPREPTTPTTREFLKVMNRLDKGQFEFS